MRSWEGDGEGREQVVVVARVGEVGVPRIWMAFMVAGGILGLFTG